VRDNAELQQRAAELKQSLLLALRQANAAELDGKHDQHDLNVLREALVQTRNARDQIEQLHKRLSFHGELERLRNGEATDDNGRWLIALVRIGVDAGYPVEAVRRMVDIAAGRIPGG
jgi:hypothetical protein